MCDDRYGSIPFDLSTKLLRHCLLIVLMTSTWNIIVLFLNVLCLWSLVFESFGKKGRKINVMILIHLIFDLGLKYDIRTVG